MLLHQLLGLWVGDGLLNRSKADVAVTAGSTENHTLKARLLLTGNDSSDGAEAHVHVTRCTRISSTLEQVDLTIVLDALRPASELRNRQTRGIRHEETTSLLQNLLKLHLLVVLHGKLLTECVQVLQLGFVLLQLGFKGLQQLSTALSSAGSRARGDYAIGGVEEIVYGTSIVNRQIETVAFVAKVTELALQLIAAFHVGNITALEWGQIRIQVCELEHAKLSQVTQTLVCSILVDDEGDVLHFFGAEPSCHGER
mmetsp:Transcript_7030/g.10347  ORF Transcript_7030/g.10347 Transcript_7030/m.10347 type:complete len:255 (+) Transcript_7030:873-1637(+)